MRKKQRERPGGYWMVSRAGLRGPRGSPLSTHIKFSSLPPQKTLCFSGVFGSVGVGQLSVLQGERSNIIGPTVALAVGQKQHKGCMMEIRRCPKCGDHEGFGLMVKEVEGVYVSCLCGWEVPILTGFYVSPESGVGKKVFIGRVEMRKYASVEPETVLVANYMPEEEQDDEDDEENHETPNTP